ncbi:hypothetical protein ABIA32_002418 [Streptacidiphilus sp. MAP12-20]|uniref:hypothetical protein n=1 Tax=Streptacidiphilus sp. MAP12-20 TaxID=3156299 RepID=UPI0035139B61
MVRRVARLICCAALLFALSASASTASPWRPTRLPATLVGNWEPVDALRPALVLDGAGHFREGDGCHGTVALTGGSLRLMPSPGGPPWCAAEAHRWTLRRNRLVLDGDTFTDPAHEALTRAQCLRGYWTLVRWTELVDAVNWTHDFYSPQDSLTLSAQPSLHADHAALAFYGDGTGSATWDVSFATHHRGHDLQLHRTGHVTFTYLTAAEPAWDAPSDSPWTPGPDTVFYSQAQGSTNDEWRMDGRLGYPLEFNLAPIPSGFSCTGAQLTLTGDRRLLVLTRTSTPPEYGIPL